MRKISTLKTAGYVSLALGLGLLSLPALGGNAYADEECDGPTNVVQLAGYLLRPNPGTITLCGNITGGINILNTATIDLNGYTVTGTRYTNALSATGRNSSLTIIGDGTVNGGLSGNLNIQGGSYDRDPSQFVESPLAAYQVDGRWIIDVELTGFAVEPHHKALRAGQTFQITTNLADLGSTSGVVYTADDENIASVDENGVVTATGEGATFIMVSPSYDTTIQRVVDVSVYSVKAEDESSEADAVAASTLMDAIDDGYLPKNPRDASDEAKEVFGEGAEYRSAHLAIRSAMGSASELTAGVVVDDEVEPTEEEVALVEEALADYDINDISYFDVSVLVSEFGDPIANLHKLNDKVVVALTEVEDPADGYSRKYVVVTIHNGEARLLTEGEDFYIEDGVLYLTTDEFSLFAVSYVDTKIETPAKTPATGAATVEGGSATSSANMAAVVAGAIAAIVMGGAALIAKCK